MNASDVPTHEVADLVSRWWFAYDEGDFAALAALLAPDAHFTCRTDTGDSPFEEFVRCDVRGAEAVMAWHSDHRLNSPYPLRHNGTNVHVTGRDGGGTRFASYIFVTKVVKGVPANISSGTVTGAVAPHGGRPVFQALSIVLDTMDSLDHLPEDRSTAFPHSRPAARENA